MARSRMPGDRGPHIGEYRVKTNAIGDFRRFRPRQSGPETGSAGKVSQARVGYCPWLFRT
jgi:hypothetical protein